MLPDNSPEPKAPTRRSTRVPSAPMPTVAAPAPAKKAATLKAKKQPTTAVKKAVAVKKAAKAKAPAKSTTKSTTSTTKTKKAAAATTARPNAKKAASTTKTSKAPKASTKTPAKVAPKAKATKKEETKKETKKEEAKKETKKEEAKKETKKEETNKKEEEEEEEEEEEKDVKPASASGKKRSADTAEPIEQPVGKRGKSESSVKKEEVSDANAPSSGFKLTIERCNTCTQYRSNVIRITKLTNKLYPGTEVEDEMIASSKKFEIYLGRDGDKGKLIWSGHSRAPPKRLAFPDSDVFIDLLKVELSEE